MRWTSSVYARSARARSLCSARTERCLGGTPRVRRQAVGRAGAGGLRGVRLRDDGNQHGRGRDRLARLVRLDADGAETASVRDASSALRGRSRPRRRPCTGSRDEDVAYAPPFAEIAGELLGLLDGAVFVAHNAASTSAMLQHAFARRGDRLPPARSRVHARGVPAARAARRQPPPAVDLRATRDRARTMPTKR